ncbi:WYL domain-containing protein [Serratia marcescens]
MNAIYFILPVVIAIYSYVYTRSIRNENKNLKSRISVLENELGEIEKKYHQVVRSKDTELLRDTFVNDNYRPIEYKDSNSSLTDFASNLSIVWAGEQLGVEFSYRDSDGNTSRRDAYLEEVAINSFGEPYFYAYCMDKGEMRHFKVDRITSKIGHYGLTYSVNEFFSDVLGIDYKKLSTKRGSRK